MIFNWDLEKHFQDNLAAYLDKRLSLIKTLRFKRESGTVSSIKGSSEGVPQEASDDDENQSNIQKEDDDNGEHNISSRSGQKIDIENNELGHI